MQECFLLLCLKILALWPCLYTAAETFHHEALLLPYGSFPPPGCSRSQLAQRHLTLSWIPWLLLPFKILPRAIYCLWNLLSPSENLLHSMAAAHRGSCETPHSARFSSRPKAVEILWFIFIFLSLTSHGDAYGPDSCNYEGGLCRVGNCVSSEYLARFCFEPIILCCKSWSHTTRKS